MSEHQHNPADQGGALRGFFGGAIAILVIVVAIVVWTNSRLRGHEGTEKSAVEAAK